MHVRQVVSLALLLAICLGAAPVKPCRGLAAAKSIPADNAAEEGREAESIRGESTGEFVGGPTYLLVARLARLQEGEPWGQLCEDGCPGHHTTGHRVAQSRAPPLTGR